MGLPPYHFGVARSPHDRVDIDVLVNGRLVKQRCVVEDWSFITAVPVNGESVFHIKHFRPISGMSCGVLSALVDDLLVQATDPAAARQLAIHLRGMYLNPEGILNHRALTMRDLEHTPREGTIGGRTSLLDRFEALVSSYAKKVEPTADLEQELVSTLTRLPYEIAAAQKPAKLLLKSVMLDHNKLFAQLRSENGGDLALAPAVQKPTRRERKGRHRIRQKLLDHLPDDTVAPRIAAFRYSCDADALVERANRLILGALREQAELSAPEVRLFEELYLRRQASATGTLVFDGIFGHRPLLLSMLRFSPSTISYLVLARCWSLPTELRGSLERGLQIQLIAALRAATEVLNKSREAERLKRRRAPLDDVGPSISRTQLDAQEVVAHANKVTPRQLEVCQHLADGETITETAHSLRMSFQAVQNALRRGLERVWGPKPAAASRKSNRPQPKGSGELSARPPVGGPDAQYISTAVIRRRPQPTERPHLGEHGDARPPP